MQLRIRLAALSFFAWIAAGMLGPQTAGAIEVQCVEASKYKYLYLIFGNDRGKFAQYLQVSESRLPSGEDCRAVIITGRIEMSRQSKAMGQTADADQIMQAVGNNKGWLATAYLASGGGNIGMGLAMAQMVRMFWLKTDSPNAEAFIYWPDFIPRPASQDGKPVSLADAEVPPELAAGWRAYVNAIGPHARVALPAKRWRCASACTFLHVAGIERHGTMYVHRGRPGVSKPGKDPSMAQILESLHRAENRVIALYRNMDGGEDTVQLFQATPTATVRPIVPARHPRYISDFLRKQCKADSVELLNRETKLRAAMTNATAEQADRLKTELAALQKRRGTVERCGAAAHEKERLAQFAKFCQDACDRRLIVSTVNAKLRELGPTQGAAPRPKSGNPPRPNVRP